MLAEPRYQIALPIFEGPMDLLLHLIRENRLDIWDIPIAEITRQYLGMLELMKELNLEVAGEFLVMAATLIHIKSRMLLPADESAEDGEPEDPRAELVQRLIEYQRFRETTDAFRDRETHWRQLFARPAVEDRRELPAEEDAPEPELFDFSLFDLITTFRRLLEARAMEVAEITRETLTVKDRIHHIIERMEGVESLRFEALFDDSRTRRELIVTFLALLEVLRLGLVRVYQERQLAPLWILVRPKEG